MDIKDIARGIYEEIIPIIDERINEGIVELAKEYIDLKGKYPTENMKEDWHFSLYKELLDLLQ